MFIHLYMDGVEILVHKVAALLLCFACIQNTYYVHAFLVVKVVQCLIMV